MKKLNMLLAACLGLAACKKEQTVSLDAGAINVTNAVVGGTTLTLMANGNPVSYQNKVSLNNSSGLLPLVSGQTNIRLGTPPVAATATAAAILEVDYFTQSLAVTNQSNYSLFLTGGSLQTIESVLINENYPSAYQDSTCGVRFINLAQGNTPISVNLKNSANGPEAASIAYKAYTGFNKYPAKNVNSSYTFEFRNAATGLLIRSYTLSTPYFHNVTLALRGTIGGSTGVILVNNY